MRYVKVEVFQTGVSSSGLFFPIKNCMNMEGIRITKQLSFNNIARLFSNMEGYVCS